LAAVDTALSRNISTIRVESDSGIIITLMPDEVSVALGFSDYEFRISKLQSIISAFSDSAKRPLMVDVRYGDVVQFIYPEEKGDPG